MKNKSFVKIISIVLAVAILVGCVPMMASAGSSKVRFAVLSDIHYLAPSLKGGDSEEWAEYVYNKHKEYNELDSLVDNALDGAKRNKVDYVLIPGDMTKDGELESHKALAARLEKFESETGIPVFVIPGNHDIHNSNAVTFENGTKEPAEITEPEQFREIYANLGFDLADSFFVPEDGKKGGMLSYAATIGNYRLICADTCMYSEDNGAENNEHMTDGRYADGLLEWIVDECEKANEKGLTIIGMQHHNLIPHNDIEEATLWAFVTQNWLEAADTLADNGMHYMFTGHLHSTDVASHISDNGEAIYDILTPTLSGFPNNYRIVDFQSNGKKTEMKMETLDIDKYQNVKSDSGTVYPKPFAYTYSYERTFGESSVGSLVMGMIKPLIVDTFDDIDEIGGLGNYLKSKNLDLEKIIVDALGTNGLELGPVKILTVSDNVMGFINDLFEQIDEVYVANPDETVAKVETILNKILDYRISDLPATMLSDKLGYTVNQDGCTFGEFATSVLLSYYYGDEDISNYPYVGDVLDAFASGELAEEIFNLLVDVIIHDLLEDEILANLDFNPGELFPEWQMFYLFGRILQGATETLLGGDNSFSNLIDSVLSLSVVPDEYSSIENILDTVLSEYLTFSQFESWGYTMNWMVGTFFIDSDPDERSDRDVTLTYSGPVEVEVTKDNYRSPSHIVMNLGEDSSTQASITWLTKYSLTDTDIEIVPYSDNPVFTGKPSVGSGIETYSETIEKSYPGADLGIFGLLDYSREYVKHTVKLSQLEPGTKYSYRVGNAKYGWWSEAGVIETAGGNDDAFTFFYITDPQSQQPSHYKRFADVISTASQLYPDAKFIVSAGDQVDYGKNIRHWNYFFNSTDAFLALPFMPTTGNHEDEGAVITENFVLPNVPDQDLDSGVYYSYDYNNVHFTVLNTNDDADDKLGEEQIEWLKNDIKSSDAKWKIVVLHKAMYSNGSHYDDGEVEGIRTQLGTLLPYLGVDLVLQGHDHVYLRTDSMIANAVAPAKEGTVSYNGLKYLMKYNPKGTLYSICGTSGVKVYQTKNVEATDKSFPRAEKLYADAENSMFSAITVDGDNLYYNAYTYSNGTAERFDNFAIQKTDKALSEKIENKTVEKITEKAVSKFDSKYVWKFLTFVFTAVNSITGFFTDIL